MPQETPPQRKPAIVATRQLRPKVRTVQGPARMAISVCIPGSLVGAMRISAVPPLRGEWGGGGGGGTPPPGKKKTTPVKLPTVPPLLNDRPPSPRMRMDLVKARYANFDELYGERGRGTV